MAGTEGRVASWRRRGSTAGRRALDGLDAARTRSRAVDALVLAYERDRDAVGSLLAGAVAFRFFVYALPLVLGVTTLIGALRRLDTSAPAAVGEELGMSSYLVDSVESAAQQSERGLWILVPLAVWASYVGGLGVVKVLRAVHAIAWGRPPPRLRNSVAATAAAFGLATAVFAAVGGLQALREQSGAAGLALAILGVVPFAGLWLLTSSLLPRDPAAPWTALIPGALVVGVATWGAHLVSAHYLARRVSSASELYGSLGVAAAILAWLYLMGRVIVAAAMLNATLWERRSSGRPPAPADGPA